MPDKSKVMIQTKGDALVNRFEVGRMVDNTTNSKVLIVEKLLVTAAGGKLLTGDESHTIETMASNREMGQGSSRTVALVAEEDISL